MLVELREGFSNLREQRRAAIAVLAQELGRDPSYGEIAYVLDVSRSYASSLVNDPDGALERERKSRYAGVCETCGGPTSGADGRGKAPKNCMKCITGNAAPPRATRPRKIWDEQKCLDSIVRWVERNGRIPRAIDLLKAEPGERPCMGTIVRHCYRYRRTQHHGRHWDYVAERVVEGPYEAVRLVHGLAEILVELVPRLPLAAIVTARNAALRANLFEVVGIENIIKVAGEKVSTDDYGTLWRIEDPSFREDVLMVEVVNSSPEPDGSFKDYFLRVPPDTETPRAGVAWTFAIETEDEYAPAVQT